MAKGTTFKAAVSAKCSRCGNPLPLDNNGIPSTSLWNMGNWFCPDCKFNFKKPDADAKGEGESK